MSTTIFRQLQAWTIREDFSSDQLNWYRRVAAKEAALSREHGAEPKPGRARSVAAWALSRPNLNHSSASCRRRGALGNATKTADAHERYRQIIEVIATSGLTYKQAAQQFSCSLDTVKRAARWSRNRGAHAGKLRGAHAEHRGAHAGIKTSRQENTVIDIQPISLTEKVAYQQEELATLKQLVSYLGHRLDNPEPVPWPPEDERQAARHSQARISSRTVSAPQTLSSTRA